MVSILEKTTGLVAFVRTVDAGSFSAASRLIGSSQSAVSKSVARLEHRLGVRLIQRSTRRLRPSGPHGHAAGHRTDKPQVGRPPLDSRRLAYLSRTTRTSRDCRRSSLAFLPALSDFRTAMAFRFRRWTEHDSRRAIRYGR